MQDEPRGPRNARARRYEAIPTARPGWTDLTYLLHKYRVTWASYVQKGAPNDCLTGPIRCYTSLKSGSAPGMWNPLPNFTDVRQDHQRAAAQEPLSRFYAAAKHGRLPNVSWITPDWADSDHPGAEIGQGQAWVTKLVNAVMKSPDWNSTAIFLAWDDWGGFYDHVGRRSSTARATPGAWDRDQPYAKRGHVDHQILSFDAYKFIEDDFLGGPRIDPKTDGYQP